MRALRGTNYFAFYHFLEGLADHKNWPARISHSNGRVRRIPDSDEISRFTNRTEILNSFRKLLEHFWDNFIVLSYQSNGIASKDEVERMLYNLRKDVKVYSRPHRYVLSSHPNDELLFVAT